ncbi:hypothetical protein N7448_003148 [Penicillium atrosanguineum]|uniref:Uncharacterized protein n=1 Tax=Penicillium atrosanguineum TaxID=1132637 RepID=A0A9W9L7B9_9EURO|nr:uncharacterized protein N7443_002123 [Penicillium atrosanguineum]KAJ5139740.1 hypothetical protein N7448_003148 [Penicillium atrosanguineum]KAJ5309662.1 hypothetical protein N7443_002123 [Penicillium atrosanguineum]KAJ5315184.1 hypothetical protein N7476_005491 [Penicillium atrosanguineum]
MLGIGTSSVVASPDRRAGKGRMKKRNRAMDGTTSEESRSVEKRKKRSQAKDKDDGKEAERDRKEIEIEGVV